MAYAMMSHHFVGSDNSRKCAVRGSMDGKEAENLEMASL